MTRKESGPLVRDALDRYKSEYPDLRIVLINREGNVTHDTAGILA